MEVVSLTESIYTKVDPLKTQPSNLPIFHHSIRMEKVQG